MKSTIVKFLLFVFAQTLLKGTSSQTDCNPYTKCASNSAGHKVIDPKNCSNYYICVQDVNGNVVPSDNVYECGSSHYFSESSQTCYSGSCTNDCLNICNIECTNYEYERIADSNDCSYFYTCRPEGFKVKSQCPIEAYFFDGEKCTTDSFSCCDTCVPFCEKTYVEVRDPLDCRSYYMCTETGQPSESDKYTCPQSEYFDPSVGKCAYEDPSNPCSALCLYTGSTSEPPYSVTP